MSALGHKQTLKRLQLMSALPPSAEPVGMSALCNKRTRAPQQTQNRFASSPQVARNLPPPPASGAVRATVSVAEPFGLDFNEFEPGAGAAAARPAELFFARRTQALSSAHARFVSGEYPRRPETAH